jgi:hypothetical protein
VRIRHDRHRHAAKPIAREVKTPAVQRDAGGEANPCETARMESGSHARRAPRRTRESRTDPAKAESVEHGSALPRAGALRRGRGATSRGGRAARLAALALPALLAATEPLSAQTLSFATVEIDPAASGDDKAVADLDGDGYADGVLGGASLAWWRSLGKSRQLAGPYAIAAAQVEFTTDMTVADVDADGDLDLVLADGNGAGNVLWFENPRLLPPPGKTSDPTDGANWTRRTVGTHGSWAHDVEAADLDGDGRLDVATCGNGAFKIFFRDAGGGWTTVDFAAHADDGSPAIADVDGDGDLDLFVAGGWLEQPAAPNRRDPAHWSYHPIDDSHPGDGPAAVALDVDRDGRVDLVTAPQHSAGTFAWFENPTVPTSPAWPAQTIDAEAGSHHLRAADFDGDGRLDLLAALELGEIVVWRISGDPPQLTAHPVAASGGHNADAGDFDGDGRPEIWAADYIGHPPLRLHWNTTCDLFCDGFETGGPGRWSQTAP